jgi:hypothetical protein
MGRRFPWLSGARELNVARKGVLFFAFALPHRQYESVENEKISPDVVVRVPA